MVDEKYTWTIKMTNGEVYQVLSKEKEIGKFLKTLIPNNLDTDVTGFELATPTVKGNNYVAIFAKEVVAVEWEILKEFKIWRN